MSSGGGSKTTTQVTKNEVPEYIESAGKKAEAMADYVSQLGYVPNYGLDVAGFSPLQSQAFQNTANAGSAFFGNPMMDANAYMPQTKTNNLGFTGYSSGDLYDQSMAALQQRAPAQYDAITDMFIDPLTGDRNVLFTPVGSVSGPNAGAGTQAMTNYNPSSTYDGPAANAKSFHDSMISLNEAPSWLYALPVVGTAKAMAAKYVADKQQDQRTGQAALVASGGSTGYGAGSNRYGGWGTGADTVAATSKSYGGGGLDTAYGISGL